MSDDDTETPPPVIHSLHPETVASRLRRGWSFERATSVVNGRRDSVNSRYVEAFGERMILSDWSRRFGVSVPTLIRRLASGWPAERAVTASDGRVVHQQSPRGRPSPEYRVWASMIQRCTNPATKGYASYGARGIRVCAAWVASFEAFLRDVGPRPAGTTLDRIDGGGHYEPGNVRWATPKQQRDNAGNTHWVEFNGERRTRADWARAIGLTYTALRQRLDSGWPIEAALTLPKGSRRPS
jgi:hypothetical protein